MFGIGMPELIIILIIILIIFGAGKLPEIGAGMGKAIKNFKKATSETENTSIETEKVEPADKLEQQAEADSESAEKK
jgi:sec-independent protein translocase protein TatA